MQKSLEPGTLCSVHPSRASTFSTHIIKTHPTLKISLQAAAGRLGWGRTRAERERCGGVGWGDIPELGNSRDKLGIWDEGEGPLTRLGAQRRAHTTSSLFQPSRSGRGGLLAWLSPVLGQGPGGVLMGPGGAGSYLVQAWGGGPGNPMAASWEHSVPFPGAQQASRRGQRGLRVLFGCWAVRIPSAGRLSRRPLGQGNKAPFSSGERRPASCVQLCAPWEPPPACWPLRLPGDEGLWGPPHP